MELWNGYRIEKTEFMGKELITVFPDRPNGRWVLKTEYFGAFPSAELELLRQGYHIFHITNETRWHVWSDTERRAKLAEYVRTEYGLSQKCVIVGMSCGGMQGIYFAANYPEYVSCMYLDAPVVNLLSCPAGIGKAIQTMLDEFIAAKGMDMTALLSYRDHPLDYIPLLTSHNIPIILVAGDRDTVVPYDENGIHIDTAYRAVGNIIETIIKPGCDHHPHGLEDNTPIIEFINKYDVD